MTDTAAVGSSYVVHVYSCNSDGTTNGALARSQSSTVGYISGTGSSPQAFGSLLVYLDNTGQTFGVCINTQTEGGGNAPQSLATTGEVEIDGYIAK